VDHRRLSHRAALVGQGRSQLVDVELGTFKEREDHEGSILNSGAIRRTTRHPDRIAGVAARYSLTETILRRCCFDVRRAIIDGRAKIAPPLTAFSPKKRCPFQFVPVIALATCERLR
jgi:hypothetical protein